MKVTHTVPSPPAVETCRIVDIPVGRIGIFRSKFGDDYFIRTVSGDAKHLAGFGQSKFGPNVFPLDNSPCELLPKGTTLTITM